MTIEQKAGNVTVTAYTDGAPIQSYVTSSGERIKLFGVNELMDLQYAVSRVLDQIKAREAEKESDLLHYAIFNAGKHER